MWRKALGLLMVLVGLGLGEDSWGQEVEKSQLEMSIAAANEGYEKGQYKEAQGLFEEILWTQTHTLGPEHPETLTTKAKLASTLWAQGDFPTARAFFEDVLQAQTHVLGSEHPSTLRTKANLSVVLHYQGNFPAARTLYEEVLQTQTRVLGSEHPSTLTTKANLADTLKNQGDFSAARALFEEVLQTQTRVLGHEYPSTLTTKSYLAGTLKGQGDLPGARALFEQVLQTKTRVLGHEHPSTLTTKANLASTLTTQGDLPGARALFEQVLQTQTHVLGHEHPSTLHTKYSLAVTLKAQGDFLGTRNLIEEALSVEEKIFGFSAELKTGQRAQARWGLGEVYEELGDYPKAVENFLMAIYAAEGQTSRVNASEDERSTFHIKYDYAYQHTIKTLLSLNRSTEAFELLQRYQAQSFQRQLFQRIHNNAKVPQALQSERYRLSWAYDRLIHTLHGSDQDAERLELRSELDELQRALQLNRDAILEATGQKTSTVALTFDKIQQSLTPGTLVLSYLTSTEGILLFTLDHNGNLTVHTLEIDLPELRQQTARFFDQSTANPGGDGEDPTALRNRARLLYDKLLAPAAEQLARSERAVVIPDGPLHYLPFAALVMPENNPDTERDWQYFVEWKPIHIAASASVYAHLRQTPRQPPVEGDSLQIAAVGDPDFPATDRVNSNASRLLASAQERSLFDGLVRLPHSGREVDILVELYGPGSIEVLKRTNATEESVKSLLPKAKILHFATHGVVDDERPLDSFIALTIPETLEEGEDNGILQAWELDDQSLVADLVILSACKTAMGENRGGEGIVSLGRAFQAAGARSVVASLWSVADASTAELMVRFHQRLRDGLSKNEALRQAQIELIRNTAIRVPKLDEHGRTVYDDDRNPVIETRNFSHPYHWAAFQLIGDWQ